MLLPRYFIAGLASLLLHTSLLSVARPVQQWQVPAGNQNNAVALTFVSRAPAQVKPKPVNSASSVDNAQLPTETAPQNHTQPQSVRPPASPETAPDQSASLLSNPAQQHVTPRREVVKKMPPEIEQERKIAAKTQKVTKKSPPKKLTDQQQKSPEPDDEVQVASRQGVNVTPELIEDVRLMSKPRQPHYPRLARNRGIEGVATYEVWIDANGQQIKQILISSSGAPLLDNSALDAIKQWQFSPYKQNGRRIAHRVQIPVRFKLDG